MKITIVMGFFLPVPPVAGGAVEKLWWRLAAIFAKRGHTVTILSRAHPGWPEDEITHGVRVLRQKGWDHRASLWQNLLLDACWGIKALGTLPAADILVTNTVALPVFVRRLKPNAGLLVVNLNRFPKGQVRWYGGAARLQAASSVIAAAVRAQAPALAGRLRVMPNPVNCRLFARAAQRPISNPPLHIGYIGRIHPEKGLVSLIKAVVRLSRISDLPAWRLILRGPVDVAHGGGGHDFIAGLRHLAPDLWAKGQIALASPLFDEAQLASAYQSLDLFCYPTEAEKGEAHPVAVLEAMAAGVPVIASNLPCFADQLRNGANALLVPPANPPALADSLARLLGDAELRQQLAASAQEQIWALDDEVIATQHLDDFAFLHSSSIS